MITEKIRIFVEGREIELPFATSVEMEINSPAFDDQIVSGAFSWPIQVPMTPSNRDLFGYADLPEASIDFSVPRDGRFTCGGFDVECKISLTAIKKESFELKVKLGSSTLADTLAKKTLRDMGWPAAKNMFTGTYYTGPLPEAFANAGHLTSYLPAFQQIVIDWASEVPFPEEAGYVCDPILHNFNFEESPGKLYNYFVLSSTNVPDIHPQVQALAIVRQMAAWLGISLQGGATTDKALQRIICYNRNTWPVVTTPYGYAPAGIVNWANFVPPIIVGDWLKAFCKYFFLAPFWSLDGKRLFLETLSSIAGQAPSLDWTDKIVSLEGELDQDEATSFCLKYAGESSDDFSQTYFVEDWSEAIEGAAVATFSALPIPGQIDEVRKVVDADFYYKYDDRDTVWERYAMPFRPFNPNGETSYEPNAAPIWSYHVPGSGVWAPRVNQKAEPVETPRFLVHLGKVSISTDPSPVYYHAQASHLNVDGQDTQVPFSHTVLYEGAAGIYERRGKAWLDTLLRKRKTLKIPVLLSALELSSITLKEKVQIGNCHYLIKQIKAKFPISGPCEVTLLMV